MEIIKNDYDVCNLCKSFIIFYLVPSITQRINHEQDIVSSANNFRSNNLDSFAIYFQKENYFFSLCLNWIYSLRYIQVHENVQLPGVIRLV